MEKKIYLKEWEPAGEDKIKLIYHDGDVLFVSKVKFDQSFGAIINASKEDVIRDFAVKE